MTRARRNPAAFERVGMKVNPVVFFVSAGAILVFVVLGGVFTNELDRWFVGLQESIVRNLGWIYILSVAVFLVFSIWLCVSRYGHVRLGPPGERPKYGYFTWFSMLFSAGMGIGLLFYSVAEPILHFTEPLVSEPMSREAATEALHLAFFHWGLHAWGIYIVVGLSLSYFTYRRGLPLSVRSALYPLLGNRIDGLAGDVVEILAVFGTLFGVATSLGIGALQINEGLSYLDVMSVSRTNQLVLITGITAIATMSVVSGLDRGIRRLSELNLVLGLFLLFFVLVTGPTVFLISSFVQGLGYYGQHLIETTFRTGAFDAAKQWQSSWTMFYWAWWISWSPFVGMFIARVSRGRTIREFILGVLFVPSLVAFLWFSVFGSTALYIELFGNGGIAESVQESIPTALYVLLGQLPWPTFTAALATIVIVTYFVTSSDSASLVIDILTASGDPNPPVGQRVFWALAEGAVAAVLLVAGGLRALQTAVITMALPFTFVLAIMCWGLFRALRTEEEQENLP